MSEFRAAMAQICSLALERECWPLKRPFRITGYTFTEIEILMVTLTQGEHIARGEAVGVYYRDDHPAGMMRQLESLREEVESGMGRDRLRDRLPPGGARNALDCALWDLEAQCTATPVSELLGLSSPQPVETMLTVGAGSAEEMAASAQAYGDATFLKLKLTGESEDIERLRAVRSARPDVRLAVDANQGYSRAGLEAALPTFLEADVCLLEQPLPVGEEAALAGLDSPIPIVADESVLVCDDIAPLVGLVDGVNIKLDKCGGLTEALRMVATAREHEIQVMVGNMVGTSLAMAPAFLVAQLCDFADLDGPLHLAADRQPPVRYAGGHVHCPPEIWGTPRR